MIKFVLLDNYFSDFFTEVQIWYWKHLKFDLGHVFRKIKQILSMKWLFSEIGALNEDIKCKGNFFRQSWSYNLMFFNDFLMFYQNFLSPQEKQIVIISNKHDIYELPHELPNDLRLRILENLDILRRSKIFKEL